MMTSRTYPTHLDPDMVLAKNVKSLVMDATFFGSVKPF